MPKFVGMVCTLLSLGLHLLILCLIAISFKYRIEKGTNLVTNITLGEFIPTLVGVNIIPLEKQSPNNVLTKKFLSGE